MLAQADDSVFGTMDPASALRPPQAVQSTAALRPQAPAAQTTTALRPPAPARPAPVGGDPLAGYYQKVRAHESGGNDAASSGVAYGRYQFTPQTWLAVAIRHPELGLDKSNILDGAKQDEAMRALTQDNAVVLQKNGIEVTPSNLFMLHFLGEGGGPKFLKALRADPSAVAPALFPLETKYNPTIFHKPDGQPRTLAEVYGLMTKSFGGDAADVAGYEEWQHPPGTRDDSGPDWGGNRLMPGSPYGADPQSYINDLSNLGVGDWGAMQQSPKPSAGPGPWTPVSFSSPKTEADADLPPGAVPIQEVDPSLPPGAVPIGAETGYQTDASGNLTVNPVQKQPVDDVDAKIVGTNLETGEPIYADPEVEKRFLAGKTVPLKGVLAGAARDVTGPASLLPNALGGGYAQEATNALNQIGDPLSRGVGGMLPFAALGVPEMGALQPSVAGAMIGAGSGLAAGTQGSSKETTELGRLNEKLPTMLGEGIAGGVLGGLAPGATWLAGKAADELGSLGKTITGGYGREAKSAAEALRAGARAETGKAMSAEEREIAEKAAQTQETEARGKLAAEFQSRVSQRVRERVAKAEKAAKEAGLNAEEAKGFAVEQERGRAAAEEDASQLVEQFRNRMPTTPEELGDQIRDAALKDMREQRAVRERDSGFAKAVASDKGQPSIPTRQFTQKIAEAERRAVSPGAQSTLAWLKGELKTAQPGGSITAVSIQRARRIVQALDSRIEGLPPDEAHEITALKDAFVEHIENTHPVMKTAREEYARLSRPLDVYERTGALKKSVQSDPYSGDAVVDSTRIAGALLNKSENGADALARLAARDPKMLESIRGYFNQQLFGAGKSVTPRAFEKFLADNHIALERVGLGDLKDVETAKMLFKPDDLSLKEITQGDLNGVREFEIHDPKTGRIGYAEVSENGEVETGLDLHVHWVGRNRGTLSRNAGSSRHDAHDIEGSNTLGSRTTRQILRTIQRQFPDAKTMSGERITGGRAAAGSDKEVSIPLRPIRAAEKAKTKGPLAEDFESLKAELEGKQQNVVQAKIGEATAAERAKLAEQSRKGAVDRLSGERNLLGRARQREVEVAKMTEKDVSNLASERAKAENLRTHLAGLDNRLDPSVAKKIPDVTREARGTANFLQSNHYITDAQHKELLAEIEKVDQSNETAEKAAKRLKQVIVALAVASYPSYELGHYVSHRFTP